MSLGANGSICFQSPITDSAFTLRALSNHVNAFFATILSQFFILYLPPLIHRSRPLENFFLMNLSFLASKQRMARFCLIFLFLAALVAADAQPILRTNNFQVPPLLSGPSAFAPGEAPPTNKFWSGNIALGLTLTRGNSRTLLASASAHTVALWDHKNNELILDGNAGYGTTDGQETTETADFNAQFNRTLTKRIFVGLKLDLFHDGIADIRYRVTVAPLIGYYAIKTTNTLLGLEFGPGYIDTRQDDESESYAILRFGERYEYKFTKTARVWQTVEIMPQVNEFANYLVNFELGAESSLTKTISLRAVLQDYYNNIPAPGREANDIRLVTGVSYKF
jgi:putative salt-induced outer membrane protein YdiY